MLTNHTLRHRVHMCFHMFQKTLVTKHEGFRASCFFVVAQLPTDVPHSKYCEQMCVTIPELLVSQEKGGNQWLHPFLVEVSFLVHFGLLPELPIDSILSLQSLNLECMAMPFSLGCWAPEGF